MYGMAECFIAGRVTADFALRKGEGGSYCYFSVAINRRPKNDSVTGGKIELPTLYLNLQANGPAAEVIATYVKKGTWFQGWCVPKTGKPREVEKDGKIYVYRDTVFRVQPGRFDFMNPDRKGEDGNSDAAQTGAAAKPAPSQNASYTPPAGGVGAPAPMADPDDDDFEEVDDGPDTRGLVDSSLPF